MTAETPAAKKSSLGKWLLYIGSGLAGLIIILGLLYYFLIDGYIRGKIVEAAKNGTGQESALKLASLHAFSGNLTLDALDVNNPAGFSIPKLLELGSGSITVNTGSLFSNTIVVDEIRLEGLTLSIEQNGAKNNLMEIVNYLQAQRGQQTAGAAAAPTTTADPNAGKSKDLSITVVRIIKPVVKMKILAFNETFTLSDIVFEKPLNPDGRNPKLIDLLGKILIEMGSQALAQAKLPPEIKALLDTGMGGINNLAKIDFKGMTGEVTKQLGSAEKAAEDAAKNAVNGVPKIDLPKIDIKLPGSK